MGIHPEDGAKEKLLINMNAASAINHLDRERIGERIEAMKLHIDTLRSALLAMDGDHI